MTGTTAKQHEEADLVVVGSSAGGIEALSILVGTLPADFPAPIVLAQHLDPTHPSNLSSILQRHTSLKIEIVNPSSLMQPGTIYVVPSDRHVIITDGYVTLQEDPHKRPRPSIDLLLSTAAAVYGERLIAVILTGSGSDGAAGGIAVKQAGGTVVIQNPQTARYPSMPLALPPTVVDFESDIERIGPLLYDLLNRIKAPEIEEKTGDTLQKIFDQIKAQTTFNFEPYKIRTIVRRLTRRMLAVQANTMQDYAQYLEAHPDEITNLVSALLINVTHFFRDPKAFAFLKREVLPKLISKGRGQDRVLRFWSAGCSTGEEAYSLAMLLADLLGAELAQWDIKIFATDLDEGAIQFARGGVYSETLLKDVPAAYRQQFFEPVAQGFRISKTLRQLITFGQHDLGQNGPFPRINLVLCRNVLIYFSHRLQNDVLGHFSFSLNSDGYLFLGKAETIRTNLSQYEQVNKTYKVYHCNHSVLPFVRRLNQSNPKRVSPGKYAIKRVEESVAEPTLANVLPDPADNEIPLRFLPMGIILIDRFYHILSTNAPVRRILGILESSVEQDFLHAVHGIPYDQVRTAIDTAFRDHSLVSLSDIELSPRMGGTGRFISLTITIMPTHDELAEVGVVSVSDVTEAVQVKQKLQSVQLEQAHLMNELGVANEALNRRNEELLDANDKLHVSNEELETAHEESQAANEELQTVNQEATARNLELIDLMDSLASERVTLKEMVELAPFFIMVLRGPTLVVQAFNSRSVQLLDGEPVQGQPLAQVADLFWVTGAAVTDLAQQAYQQNVILTSPRMLMRMPDRQGDSVERYLICTIVPSHDSGGKVYGLVIYTHDVTEQRTEEIQQELQRLQLIFDRTRQMAFGLYDAQTTKLLVANSRYLEEVADIGDGRGRELIGQTWQESTLFVPRDDALELWNTVINNQQPVSLPEVRYQFTQDPQETVWDGMLIPIIYPELPESVRFVLTYAVDMTEQVGIRQKLEQLDQLKDEWVSIAAHELRTPLTSILGNAQLLQGQLVKHEPVATSNGNAKPPDIHRIKRMVETVVHQANQMKLLINDLMDLSRIKTGHFALNINEKLDLVKLLRRTVQQQQNMTAEHAITLELTQKSVVGPVDEGALEQVVNNLMGNAIKYSPVGKPIRVGIERRLTADGANEIVIWVRDEGYGISEEQQAHIFDRFYRASTQETAQVKGIGVGLYISREIVTRHGGQIWVESTVGAGSTFYFSLPLARPSTEKTPHTEIAQTIKPGRTIDAAPTGSSGHFREH